MFTEKVSYLGWRKWVIKNGKYYFDVNQFLTIGRERERENGNREIETERIFLFHFCFGGVIRCVVVFYIFFDSTFFFLLFYYVGRLPLQFLPAGEIHSLFTYFICTLYVQYSCYEKTFSSLFGYSSGIGKHLKWICKGKKKLFTVWVWKFTILVNI